MREKIELKTKRLLLKPLGPEYLQTVHAYASDLENTKYMMHLPNETIEETLEFLKNAGAEWEKETPSYCEFAVLYEGRHIGAVSVYLEEDAAGETVEAGKAGEPGKADEPEKAGEPGKTDTTGKDRVSGKTGTAGNSVFCGEPAPIREPEIPEKPARSGELGWILHKDYWGRGLAAEAAAALVAYCVRELKIRHFIAHCDAENPGSYRVMEKLGMTRTAVSYDRKNRASDETRTEYQYEMWREDGPDVF